MSTTLNIQASFISYRFTINFGVPTRASGSNLVQIPYDGYSPADAGVSISLAQYSTDGIIFHNATVNDSAELTSLTFGPDGVSNIFTWKAYLDLGDSLFNQTIYFKMKASSTDYSTPVSLTSFIITKKTTSGGPQDQGTLPETYRGVQGSSLLGIFKSSK